MADENLRKELLYMVRLTSKYDFTNMDVVEEILRLENERTILGSVFGKRFKARIFDIATGQQTDGNCVICGQKAENQVICKHCIESIGESNYAKNKIVNKEKTKNRFLRADVLKKGFQLAVIVCLTVILFIQLWILSIWRTIPAYNPIETAINSSNEVVAVSSKEDALKQLQLDFPEEEGYSVYFGRMDSDYVGRFLLDLGECCAEVEENLTDEERYDYFFKEDVYVFYISYLEEHTAKQGVAEVNSDGAIILMGSFNNGRRTDSFYKFR